MNSQPPSSGFAFGQNGTNGTSATSTFNFGQNQNNSNGGGFAFGQSQGGSTSNSFTFGQQSSGQNGGFNFNAGGPVSFPGGSGTNPFATTNGQSGAGAGFSGNIFSIPGSANSSQQTQGATNGFSFASANGSTAPSSPSHSFGAVDNDKKEIEQREPYLNSEQLKKVEEIVGQHLPDIPSSYSKDPLDLLPQDVLSQLAQYIRSLPSPAMGSQASATSLFSKPYRAKSKKPWVTDTERNELKAAAPNLTPEQRNKLTQIVKDNVEPLKFKSDSELPSFEYLPNDVQREMLEFVRQPAGQQAQTPAKPANPFNFSTSATPKAKAAESPAAEQPKSNPFASIKSASASPAAPSKPSTPFTFGQPKPAATAQSSLPTFSFAKPAEPAAAAPSNEKEASVDVPEETASKTNPFASVSRSMSPSPSPAKAQNATPKSLFDSAPTNGVSSGFKFQPAPTDNGAAVPSATPAKPAFSFGGSKTPATSANNFFNSSAAPNPPATAPTQKTGSIFNQTASAPSSQPSFAAQKTPVSKQSQGQTTVPVPSTYVPQPGDSLITLVSKTGLLNACFRSHIKKLETYADWSAPVGYFLQELDTLKAAIKKKEQEEETAGQSRQAQVVPPSTGKPPFAQSILPPSTGKRTSETPITPKAQADELPAKKPKATPGFQISSPSKPLSNTANLFNSILSSPDKPAATVTPSKPAETPANIFKFQPPTGSTPSTVSKAPNQPLPNQPFASMASPFKPAPSPASQSAPTFSVPKFGGGGSSNNFLSSFGAQAAKESEKEKAKRKAEDFDSDDDDEEEWERKDREEQEEKRRKLAESANKVAKMVDGKMVWVSKDQANAEPPATKSTASVFDSPSLGTGTTPTPANPFSFLSKSNATEANGQKGLTSTSQEDTDEDDDEDEENRAPVTNGINVPATPAKSGGLFDRVSKNSDGTLQREAPDTAKKSVFGFSTSPAGDNTWKPETPIKFGTTETPGSTTPSGSPAKSLFNFSNNTTSQPSAPSLPKFNFGGPSADSNKPSLFSSIPSTAPPSASVGFKFGNPPAGGASLLSTPQPGSSAPSIFSSAPGSRATTPGATTADEASTTAGTDNEEDAAPAEEQKDLTALSAEELRNEEVLFEQKARCRKFVRGGESPWENKGIGIIRLLKNKESGSHRILMRLAPGGQIIINANLLKDKELYSIQNEKLVKMVFAEGQGELSTYILTFGKKESAEELLGKVKAAE
ncbi:hypothetical protein BDZ85DRAFT_42227 [Elsinoe ampelina]|uniref:RanBD1 domain-containing protein n=1 Tax=Elsinoe ampelina TaxID=302913 RepID=A0A6A6G155_9PEZI|nr:hypothetical protein BDZ85DRAFT_42227 [Elsinoe ampelina]